MKRLFFVILTIVVFASCKKDSSDPIPPDGIWDAANVDSPPEYPEGQRAFFDFVGRNLRYPKVAIENNIQGKVEVSFVVETDGTLSNIKALTQVGGGLEAEAVRAVGLSSKWKPGLRNKQPVRVRSQFTITFTLQKE